jgi:hypothetical protein
MRGKLPPIFLSKGRGKSKKKLPQSKHFFKTKVTLEKSKNTKRPSTLP